MVQAYSGNPGSVREDGTLAGSKNSEYDYVLRYIAEAIDYRTKKIAMTARAIEAYKGFPSVDGYRSAIDAYASLFEGEDKEKADAVRARCKNVHSKKNMIVQRAIDSMVAQAQGGVGQYECAPYDPTFEKSPELVDALDAAALDFYQKNHVDSIIGPMLEWAGLSGAAYCYLGYNLDTYEDNGKIDMKVIPDTEMLIDPTHAKRNRDRYIGHQTKASWADFKDKLIKCEYTDQYLLESINMVDTYLNEVEWWVSKYNGDFTQIMPAISGEVGSRHYMGTIYGAWFQENLPHHIDTFYKASALAYKDRNTAYITRPGASGEGNGDTRYRADEVEVCYLYDLVNHIQFTVINRTFIVAADTKYLTRELEYKYFEIDEFSQQPIDMVGKKKISIDHPYVELAFKKSLWETYAYSPVIHVLDMFDDLCALETMVYHTIQIMTPITFTGNPKDIEKLGAIAGVSGEAIKGFIANSVTVLNKAVDLTPAMSEISRLESNIMDALHGIDPKEQSKMVGNRATAAEAMQAASLASQGLNSLLANVETWAAELASKMFKLTVIYEDEDFTYDLNAGGQHLTLTRKDLAGNFGIRAVLKSKIKAEQMAQAANTVQWFVPLLGSDAIVNKEAFAQSVVPTIAQGFTRKAIASWFQPTEEMVAAQEAQNQLLQEQAKAVAAERKRKNIEMGYVDPSSGGRYGEAEIARALGSNVAGLDFSMEPTDGRSKPTNTTRSLTYGNSEASPDSPTPSDYVPGNGGVLPVPLTTEPVEYEDDSEGANEDTLSALLSPDTGGINANNAISGVNSPLSQGTLL